MEKAWADLAAHRTRTVSQHLRELFATDNKRFSSFSARLGDLLLDYSKTAVTGETVELLVALAEAADVEAKRDAMFAGEPINTTEGRAVLHTALRNQSGRPVKVDGVDVMPEVNAVLERMSAFAQGIRSGTIAAADGERFSDVVSIGIGGSDLGPVMATLALAPYQDGPRLHYVSNVDGAHIADTLAKLDPARTLVIVASKTFTTIETMTNAATARR
ncbi:MAG: glucose-6-phosphate isomerase, partial [Hyphomicrobiales bacterium]